MSLAAATRAARLSFLVLRYALEDACEIRPNDALDLVRKAF